MRVAKSKNTIDWTADRFVACQVWMKFNAYWTN